MPYKFIKWPTWLYYCITAIVNEWHQTPSWHICMLYISIYIYIYISISIHRYIDIDGYRYIWNYKPLGYQFLWCSKHFYLLLYYIYYYLRIYIINIWYYISMVSQWKHYNSKTLLLVTISVIKYIYTYIIYFIKYMYTYIHEYIIYFIYYLHLYIYLITDIKYNTWKCFRTSEKLVTQWSSRYPKYSVFSIYIVCIYTVHT